MIFLFSCYSFDADFPILIEFEELLRLYNSSYGYWCVHAFSHHAVFHADV